MLRLSTVKHNSWKTVREIYVQTQYNVVTFEPLTTRLFYDILCV